ncbi:hypothetical protein CLTEP_19380 [Clostridium tepidiprofundi DSM 19306]|uniref:Uncharacterized protein n=1 Tax=Clostridium tepidiprofundi DSM 19306 TaxID=1121338 RepID=A0A151B2T9_9CLOT|nr:DUF5320 domain-containing protein [Clostridium tepidiprofundi]KYH34093.1 hypothetical protein CLTEP_19380 [Clostridium tepidiprofundi DSM 19306]
MPRLDGTGPNGMGPMTGRGLGKCTSNSVNQTNANEIGYFGRGLGRGLGFGRGLGRGFRRGGGFCRWYGTNGYYGVSEETLLRQEKEILEERLNYINSLMNKNVKPENEE